MLSLQSGSWTFIIILLVMLAISSIMFGLLINAHRDIRHMVKDLTYHGKETFSIRVPGMQEFRIIADTLMDTLHRLKEANEQKQQLTTASYEALLAQKQAEMQAYRSQINPHFLFNTLETVRSLAHHYQIMPLEQLINGMSLMFRYSLYSPTMVTLTDELEHLNGYISVINVRFPGRYTIKKDISPDTLNFQVLSMLLQPVVENAVQHAFKGRKSGTVLVQTFLRADTRLGIRIVDNGIGMSAEAVSEITRKFYEPEDEPDAACTSIGLINIRKRLKLAFGDHAHLSVTSRQGYYTSVELIIPGPDYGWAVKLAVDLRCHSGLLFELLSEIRIILVTAHGGDFLEGQLGVLRGQSLGPMQADMLQKTENALAGLFFEHIAQIGL